MSTSLRDQTMFAVMLSASLASTIGGLPFNSLPVMLGSMADSFALDSKTVGLLGSACFAGYLAGTLGTPFWMNRINWRLLTIISAAGTAASFAFSATVVRLNVLYVIWAMIGFFASTMTCLGMRILSDLPNKVRAFGIRQGVELFVTSAVLFILPPLLISTWKYPGAALGLTAVVAILGISALWVPTRPLLDQSTEPSSKAALPAASWFALLIFFLFLIGNIGLWAFLERIGSSLKIAQAEMGLVFAVLKLLGCIAAFLVAIAGDRLGHRLPFLLVITGIGLGLFLLAIGKTFMPFALGAWIWEFSFTCGCVFQTATIARTDSNGRAIVLVPAVFAVSSMVGPGLAGYLLSDGNFDALLGLALISSLVPVIVNTFKSRPPLVYKQPHLGSKRTDPSV